MTKRNISPFFVFMEEKRLEYKNKYPKKKCPNTKDLSKIWNKLSLDDKKKYKKKNNLPYKKSKMEAKLPVDNISTKTEKTKIVNLSSDIVNNKKSMEDSKKELVMIFNGPVEIHIHNN